MVSMDGYKGIYRAFYVSLWDALDFLALPSPARMVLVYLRTSPLSNLPCIYRFYGEAIETHTGLEAALITRALELLSAGGWIEIESGIVWVRNALKYDPSISLKNPKHVEAIRKAISSLPKLQIVANFCAYLWDTLTVPDSLCRWVWGTLCRSRRRNRSRNRRRRRNRKYPPSCRKGRRYRR